MVVATEPTEPDYHLMLQPTAVDWAARDSQA
jgi:hypothetical protein